MLLLLQWSSFQRVSGKMEAKFDPSFALAVSLGIVSQICRVVFVPFNDMSDVSILVKHVCIDPITKLSSPNANMVV